MKLHDPDVGWFWTIWSYVGSVVFGVAIVALFVGCGKLMAPGWEEGLNHSTNRSTLRGPPQNVR